MKPTKSCPRRGQRAWVRCVAAVTILSAIVLCGGSAAAYTIRAVEVLPGPPITSQSHVELRITLISQEPMQSLYAPTEVAIDGLAIEVDVFPTTACEQSGGPVLCVTEPDVLVETVALGNLAPGSYSYVVTSNRLAQPGFDSESGGFTVLPEPGAAGLLLAGLAALGVRRRGRGSRPTMEPSSSSID